MDLIAGGIKSDFSSNNAANDPLVQKTVNKLRK